MGIAVGNSRQWGRQPVEFFTKGIENDRPLMAQSEKIEPRF